MISFKEYLIEAKIDDFTNRYMKYHASHPMVQGDPEEAKRRIAAAHPHVQGHDEGIYATKQFLDKIYNPNEGELSLKHVLKGWRKGKTNGDLTGNLSDHTHDSISRFLRSQSDAKSTVKAGKLEGMDKYHIGQIQHPEHGVLDVHQVHVNDVKDDDEFKKISDTINKHTSESCTWCVKGEHDVQHLKHYSHGHGILFYTNQRGEMVRSHGFGDRGIVRQDNTTIRPEEAHHIQKQTSALMTGKKKEVYDFFSGDTKNLSVEKQHKMYDEFGKGHAEAHFADPKRNTHPEILSRLMKSDRTEVIEAAFSHPNVTPEHISEGLKHEHRYVNIAAMRSPNVTPEHISEGLKHIDFFVRELVMKHPNATPHNISEGLKNEDAEVGVLAMRHPNASPDNISEGLKHKDYLVAEAAMRHPNATPEHISEGLKHIAPSAGASREYLVAKAAVQHPNATPGHISEGLKHNDPHVARAAIRNRNASPDNISEGLKHKDYLVAEAAVQHSNATPGHISEGLKHEVFEVVHAAIRNRNASPDNIREGKEHKDHRIRRAAREAEYAMENRSQAESLNTMKLSLDIKNTTLMETHYVVHGVDTIDVETALELLSAEELEMLAEGAKRKIVIRGGKKKIIFKCPTGQKLGKRGGRTCVKVGGAEKALRSRRAVKAARKSKGKRGRANSKRRRSMTKRSNFI